MFPKEASPFANAHIANCARPGASLSCVEYCQFSTAGDKRADYIQESTKDEAFQN